MVAMQGAALLLLLGLPQAAVAGDTGRFRQLQGTDCNSQLLETLPPVQMEEYHICVREKEQNSNMSILGAYTQIRAECWCQHNVKDAVELHSCCSDPNYAAWCAIRCDDDCSSPDAQTCMDKCPAMCLEEDYAFSGCDCKSNNCARHTLCITAHGRNRTNAGELATICDDQAFERSAELREYYQCMQESPKRTTWLRYHSSSYCVCKSNLKAALQRHSCCQSIWGQPICNMTCADTATCGSVAARTCLSDCGTKCQILIPNTITQQCHDECIGEGAACNDYKTCEPTHDPDYGYVCTDGSDPKDNGCCIYQYRTSGGTLETESCPSLCDIRHKYYFGHGQECQCFGCPGTSTDVQEKLKRKIVDEAVRTGQENLLNIARQVGLEFGPTEEMQRLMTERNKAFSEAIRAHSGDYDAELESTLIRLHGEWNDKIIAEARRAKACQDDPSNCKSKEPKESTKESTEDKADGNGVLIAAICGVMGVLVAIFGILVMVYLIKKKRGAVPAQANAHPVAGDSNVVVGRPVDNGATASDEAASGAPVATSKAGDAQA